MYNIQTIKHSGATLSDLQRAIAIKSVAWPYPMESQLAWMRDNLQPIDTHVFLQEDGFDVAYLNIAMVHANINGVDTLCAGIGNVCSTRIGRGKNLILKTNELIVEQNIPGVLFCKDKLVGFYNKYNWKLIKPNQVTGSHLDEGTNTMVFNLDDTSTIVYEDRNF